ncbi:hypothetical protein PsYK624_082440 [Phanerochaete sordida]|uniref:Protein kinase domain-containing protein n=1 Tax=Phanerochaete sordida TaxID=48140 RepID=A0A9P3GC07_9APHY|nr:hypothetical protein PsYK624_082440 [Phanerochaete sordida]
MLSGTALFVGPMAPQDFLETFMDVADGSGVAPDADFSLVPRGGSVPEMSRQLVEAVERHAVCPSLRLFQTRTRRKPAVVYTAEDGLDFEDICAPLAARKQPRLRRSQGKKKKRELVEYLDFANAVLQVELRVASEDDPFVDPPEGPSRRSSFKSCPPESPPSPCSPRQMSRSPKDKPSSSASQNAQPPPSKPRTSPPKPASPGSPPQVSAQSYDSCEGLTAEGRQFRYSLISHARTQFTCQHRAHFFQLLIFGPFARFVRWDRSGTIVSQRFNYTSDPALLSEFLWRLSRMNDAQQGWDTTVRRASRAEAALLKESVQTFLDDMKAGSTKEGTFARKLLRAERILDDTGIYPVWKIHAVNPDTGISSDLIVNRPLVAHPSLCGRATRAFIAYDLQQQRLVFTKDSWRDTDHGLQPEFDIYRELHAHGVPHVLSALYGGDVVSTAGELHVTQAQMYYIDEDGQRIISDDVVRRVHHRIAQDIAYPLATVRDERELVQALHDALCAIDAAYSAGMLHRDISYKNIMLTADGRGVLNDWDHAGSLDTPAPGIGTWKYMSIKLQENLHREHDILDDLESVFWVLLFAAAERFSAGPPHVDRDLFENSERGPDAEASASCRRFAIVYNKLHGVPFTSAPLQSLIKECSAAWRKYQIGIDDDLPEVRERPYVRAALESAPKPSFWRAKFAAALSEMPATEPTSGKKRKAEDSDIQELQLRRSQRLKGLHV